jgi:sugar/nucleoside kinase (ribokinase family)
MSNFRFDVCAVGNAIVDVLAECDDSFLQRQSIAKGGMTLIDEARADYLYNQIGPAVEMSGGSAANTVAGVASFGGQPAFIGKIRNDQLGAIFRHDLTAAGVVFTSTALTAGPATARCIILVTPDAQRSMNTFLGASVELTEADVDPALVRDAAVTYLEGYLFDKPQAKAAFRKAALLAHDAGRQLALTLSDTFCVERHRDEFHHLVKHEVDILFANEAELKSLYQTADFDQALAAARQDCALVAVTRSEQGAVIATAQDVIAVPAKPVAKLVDTTGAGDLFAAGFLFGVTHGHALAEAGRLGCVAAAEIISHYGPRPQLKLSTLLT